MGYRHYFVLVEKTKVEELRNLTMEKIKEEFNLLVDIKVTYGTTEYDMKKYGEKRVSDPMDYFYERFNALKYGQIRIHELGKLYWDNIENELLKTCKKIVFADKEVEEILTQENQLVIATKETLIEYAYICIEKMQAYYKSLLSTKEHLDYWGKEKTEEKGEEKIIHENIKSHVEQEISHHELLIRFNRKEGNKEIHVRENYGEVSMKMKTIVDFGLIDFEKYELIFCAW